MKKVFFGLCIFLFPIFSHVYAGNIYIENTFPTSQKEEIIDREMYMQILIIELTLMIIALFIKFFMRISQTPGYTKKRNIFL